MSIGLPKLFSDGMVLQRNFQNTIWGSAEANEAVSIIFLEKTYCCKADAEGQWSVKLDETGPGGPYELQINEVCILNCYVGDVWLCAGQSNMQQTMESVKYMYPDILQASNPHIRQFSVEQHMDFTAPQSDVHRGTWSGASPSSYNQFSAVGYFFGEYLYKQYKVPIGLIGTAVGGTPIHAWMGRDALGDFPELKKEADLWADKLYLSAVQEKNERNSQAFFEHIDSNDPGLEGQWFQKAHDDSGWDEVQLTQPWEGSGSFWLRKTIEIPSHMAGEKGKLFLGTIVDWDAVYVNGVRAGCTEHRYASREYTIPSLPKGKCVIAIRVISKDGGFFTKGKQYILSTDKGSINLNGKWRFRAGCLTDPPEPEEVIFYKPTGLYNGMIAPLHRYPIKGVIWYQGESDTANPKRYADKFAALVGDWRKKWGYAFPFLFVELAHWMEGENWDLLRQKQWDSLSVPLTAMAAAFDLGEHNDLHPLNKQGVGQRLARCAMRLAYGEKMEPSPYEIVGIHQ